MLAVSHSIVVSTSIDNPVTLKLISSASCTATKKLSSPPVVSLQTVIPTDFTDMYTPDLLTDTNAFGRPHFTDRQLVDWRINDIRSLLIVDRLRPEWHGQLPQVAERGYRVLHLPLESSDEAIVNTLVSSDIYKEHSFDYKFLVQTAQYTVEAAKQRRIMNSINTTLPLTKPEWRNIIENYLLNLGCEAQCRLDYRKLCSQVKRQRQQETDSSKRRVASNSLLKQAVMQSCSTSPDFPSYLKQKFSNGDKPKVSLSRLEKQTLWVNAQTKLYARLGLDWEPDEIAY